MIRTVLHMASIPLAITNFPIWLTGAAIAELCYLFLEECGTPTVGLSCASERIVPLRYRVVGWTIHVVVFTVILARLYGINHGRL